jgi:hypothetical protein
MATYKNTSNDYTITVANGLGIFTVNAANTIFNGNITQTGNLTTVDDFIVVAANNTGTVNSMGLLAQTSSNAFAGLRFNSIANAWQISSNVFANGKPVSSYANIGEIAAGANTNVQYNNDGLLAGAGAGRFSYDSAQDLLTVGNIASNVAGNISGNITGNVTGNISGNIVADSLATVDDFIVVAANNTGNVNAMGMLAQTGNDAYAGLRFNSTANAWQISSNVLANGSPVSSYANIGEVAAGVDTNVQYNANGVFAGAGLGRFTYNPALDLLTVGNIDTGNINAGNIIGNITGNVSIVSSARILYVAKNGNDANNGSFTQPFLTIKAAMAAATSNTSVHVAPGAYTEQNPVTIPTNVALIGDNLRSVFVTPANPSQDLFYVQGGSYVWGITIRDFLANGFAYYPGPWNSSTGFPPSSLGPDGKPLYFVSPYIQNITSSTTTGTSVKIDGDLVSELSTKAMILGFFTMINRGGIGVHIINRGYSQAVNIYTIACNIGLLVESGAFVTLNGSDCSIGNFGLIADGVGPSQTTANVVSQFQGLFKLTDLPIGNVAATQIQPGSQCTIITQGASAPLTDFTLIGAANNNPGTVFLANATGTGRGVVSTPTRPHVNTIMRIDGDFTDGELTNYTIGNIATIPNEPANVLVEVQQTYLGNAQPGTGVEFFVRSSIIASAHTFEYVGAGTNPATALPQYGGIPIEANEVLQLNGGVVTFTSTDQKGNFKVGSQFIVNQATAQITGDAFYKSLFAQMTPYILAISGN